jgi:hypothetical protein
MALILCYTDDGHTRAHPGGAGVGLGASIAVVATGAVSYIRVRAHAIGWVAYSRHVALIERRAHHGVRADARTRLTGVGLGAGVAVVAGDTVVVSNGAG